MRVAMEHGCKLSRSWIKVERLQVVKHVDVAAANENDICFGQLAAGAVEVNVSADRGDWGNLLKLLEDGDLAHVAKVQNALDAGQCRCYFGAEEAVGIADDADLHLQTQFEPCAGIEPVAQRVANKVEAQHSACHRGGGEEHEVRRIK